MEWAKTAKSDFERKTFLQMVQTWLVAAVYADSQSRGRRSDAGEHMPMHPDRPIRQKIGRNSDVVPCRLLLAFGYRCAATRCRPLQRSRALNWPGAI